MRCSNQLSLFINLRFLNQVHSKITIFAAMQAISNINQLNIILSQKDALACSLTSLNLVDTTTTTTTTTTTP